MASRILGLRSNQPYICHNVSYTLHTWGHYGAISSRPPPPGPPNLLTQCSRQLQIRPNQQTFAIIIMRPPCCQHSLSPLDCPRVTPLSSLSYGTVLIFHHCIGLITGLISTQSGRPHAFRPLPLYTAPLIPHYYLNHLNQGDISDLLLESVGTTAFLPGSVLVPFCDPLSSMPLDCFWD